MPKETIIISLGGSLVVPNEIDVEFLKSFKLCLEKYFDKKRFFVIVGGGKIARIYQKALLEFGAKPADRDWVGINVTKLNAQILKQVFANNSKSIIIGHGTKPGHSTDYVAVLTAKKYKAKTIINLSNIDYVYSKDPNQFSDAKIIKETTWQEFTKIVGDKWTPGENKPFDPIASKMAQKLGLKVIIVNGHKLDNLDNILNDKEFIGTVIQ